MSKNCRVLRKNFFSDFEEEDIEVEDSEADLEKLIEHMREKFEGSQEEIDARMRVRINLEI